MNKEKIIEIFEEVLNNWKMAQGCVIQEGDVDEKDFDNLEKEICEYRKSFFDALGK